ncbi:Outer membrane protein, beta-barrel [Niveomyces insectorum RCEF 264]|uniref:Outer membrane protein, beta-barrel n=1 Tax=Niveomyces insectorum RCEF 264 TaxID=1081102 RepID=A0A162LBK7_9HYPO|nr:Outer membrane protein, beta-barrel [Niveomyces insectorum RCEF 264]
MQTWTTLVFLLLAACCSRAQTTVTEPAPPGLAFLFSCNVTLGLSIKTGTGLKNTTRAVFPIGGGQAIGPKISGKILVVGADWAAYGTMFDGTNVGENGKAPNTTSYFETDARFQLVTLDGANVLVHTRGQTAPDSGGNAVHVHASFSTVHHDYAWLNDVASVGILRTNNDGYQVDLWRLTTPDAKN